MIRRFAILALATGVLPLAAQEPTPRNRRLGPGDNRVWVQVGSLLREFIVHVPRGYDQSARAPLVFVFHGSGGSGDGMSRVSSWSTLADENGFFAVYPNGFPNEDGMRVWNDGRFQTDMRADDVDFTRVMMDELQARFFVDPRRIHVVGFSNGAGLAYRLALEMADRIASIAVVAGRINVSDEAPARPVAAIAVVGTEDPGFANDTRSIARWATLLRCGTATDTVANGRYVAVTWRGCPKSADVVSWTITGWQHYWPGGTNKGIENWVEPIIWRFFEKHPRKG